MSLILLHITLLIILVLSLGWFVRRISLLRMTQLDLQECMNSPIFIIRPDGTVLSFRNPLRNTDKKDVMKMYELDKNVFDWVDESSRRILRQRITELMRTRERQEVSLTFLNSLARNEVEIIWYGPRSLAFIINMPSASHSEMEHLRSEAFLLGTILDNLPIATTVKPVHDRHRYLIANKQSGHLLCTSSSTLMAQGMSALPSNLRSVMERVDDEVIKHGVCDQNHTISLSDGTLRTLSIHKVLVPDVQNRPAWIVGSVWDISDRIEQQQAISDSQRKLSEARLHAEESDRLKEEFLRNISHEMRTPLNAIVGFSNLLVETDDNQQRSDLARIISSNCDVLVTQLEDMLQISKIQSGNLSLHPRQVDLNALVEECVAEGHWLEKPQLTYRKSLPERAYRAVLDRKQVRVILRQVIGNAIKFTDQGCIDVGYEVLDGAVRFRVSDTGVGVAPQYFESVFNRFEKAGSDRSGVGLGLTICRSLIQLMSGTIELTSQPGEGTVVTFTIPTEVTEIPADESITVSQLWDQMMTIRTIR